MKENAIVFGKGIYYEKKRKNINERYVINAFIDNAVKRGKTEEKDGVKVYNPYDINDIKEKNNTKIILASQKWFEMLMQLVEMQIDGERIVFGFEIPPFVDTIEEIFQDEQIRVSIKNNKVYLNSVEEEYVVSDEKEYKAVVRKLFAKKNPYIKQILNLPIVPVSKRFGLERGTAIDRFYIEKFLSEHQKCIHGTVMEIADNRYMKMFSENIKEAVLLHVNGWGDGVIQGNLATGEGIIENSVDCIICTQTIQCIYDIHSVVRNIYKLLKPGGTALITAASIAQLSMYDYKNWGEYWRFTAQSMRKLLSEVFIENQIEVYAYGNMKAAMGFLYGVCQEEMEPADLEYRDEQFPMIVAASARKP